MTENLLEQRSQLPTDIRTPTQPGTANAIVCRTCRIEWPRDSMAAISVQLTGECLWCHFGPARHGGGTDGELNAVRTEYERRKTTLEYAGPEAL